MKDTKRCKESSGHHSINWYSGICDSCGGQRYIRRLDPSLLTPSELAEIEREREETSTFRAVSSPGVDRAQLRRMVDAAVAASVRDAMANINVTVNPTPIVMNVPVPEVHVSNLVESGPKGDLELVYDKLGRLAGVKPRKTS